MNWSSIKAEYVTDASSSYRKIAQKYGIPENTIYSKGRAEGWSKEKKQYQSKITEEKIKNIAKNDINRATRLCNVSDKLLDKIERIVIEDVDKLTPGMIDVIANALKKIKDVQMVKSDIDLREQEARIKALEKQTAETAEAPKIVVTFGGESEEYAQ